MLYCMQMRINDTIRYDTGEKLRYLSKLCTVLFQGSTTRSVPIKLINYVSSDLVFLNHLISALLNIQQTLENN